MVGFLCALNQAAVPILVISVLCELGPMMEQQSPEPHYQQKQRARGGPQYLKRVFGCKEAWNWKMWMVSKRPQPGRSNLFLPTISCWIMARSISAKHQVVFSILLDFFFFYYSLLSCKLRLKMCLLAHRNLNVWPQCVPKIRRSRERNGQKNIMLNKWWRLHSLKVPR